jgi:3-oxocholest-4-en-26-oyl-CoA dehydrogenase beta subunit
MDLRLTEDQKLIKQSAREFLSVKCPISSAREMQRDEKGYNEELWREMAELGWMGLVFPEEYGGMGGNLFELTLLAEEMGRVCLLSPFFSTVVGGLIILEAGSAKQRHELLPYVVGGETTITLALNESESYYDARSITATAFEEQNQYSINGRKLFVPFANISNYMISVARTSSEQESDSGITLFLVNRETSGLNFVLLNTIAADKQFEVIFNNVEVPKCSIIGKVGSGWIQMKKALQMAAIIECAKMVGGGQQILDMAVFYAKNREQFGKRIGSFQAIQHHCANMLIDLDGCRWVTYKTAWMIDEGIPYDRQVAIAKAWCSDAYRRIVSLGHQVIGGVGYCEEHDMPLFFRTGKVSEVMFGDGDFHRRVLAKDLFSPDRTWEGGGKGGSNQ